ncbi:MAG TPA: RluA family pseudouridine synthase [Acidimicrobiales bacterium]|nr:RluA family pseudouridine synthase [Acidimicrobiales bacterium]
MIIEEVVPHALDGERLDRLVALVADLSRAAATELVVAGAVEIGGAAQTKPSTRVAEGDQIRMAVPEPIGERALTPDPGIELVIRFADHDVAVVDKPAGLVVHPGAGNRSGTLAHALVARFPEIASVGADPARPGIVHRLDKGTSGLLVVARTARAYEALVAQLAAREVQRTYRALVWGHPESGRGVVDAPIGRSAREPTKMAVTADGREARTSYEVDVRYVEPDVAALTCRLETGRTHQIRVHLAAIGHPVVGDDRYGRARPELELERPFLHAARLVFAHPVTGEPVDVASPLPGDLVAVLGRLQPVPS